MATTTEKNKTKRKASSRGATKKKEVTKSKITKEVGGKEKESLKGKYDPRNKLNDLTSTEWIPETVSVKRAF